MKSAQTPRPLFYSARRAVYQARRNVEAQAQRLRWHAERLQSWPPHNFVILSLHRSGSGFLYTTLDSHPDFIVHGELFKRSTPGRLSETLSREARKEIRLKFDKGAIDASPLKYLSYVKRCSGFERPFFGFKLMLQQNERVLQHVMSDQKTKLIVLTRANTVAAYSSQVTAKLTQQGKITSPGEIKRKKLHFDRDEYFIYANYRKTYFDLLRKNMMLEQNRVFQVEYTELAQKKKFDEIFSFLGASPVDTVSSSVVKRNSSNILERFENPGDVERFLDEIGHPEWVREDI